MKRATAGILATIVLGGCIAQPTPSTLPPPNPSAITSAAPVASVVPLPSAVSTATLSPTPHESIPPSASGTTGSEVVTFPTAPPETADWPTCTTFQLAMSGVDVGAGLGNAAALLRLRNVSADGCALDGYPDVQLVSQAGVELPTVVRNAVDGAYLFPAVRSQRVALEPGATASFEMAYSDNPFGAGQDLPYDQACPAARWIRVVIPGTDQFGTAELTIAPCEGVVSVSPLFPGRDRLQFP